MPGKRFYTQTIIINRLT